MAKGGLRSAASVVLLLALFSVSVLTFVPTARATITVLDGTECAIIGGSWDGTTSTCTLTGSYVLASGTFEIPSGTTLLMSGSISATGESFFISSGAILQIQSGGEVDIQDSFNCVSGQCVGLYNDAGSIANSGTIAIGGTYDCSNVSGICFGLLNIGSLANAGTVTVGGTYGCSSGSFCVGLYDDVGSIANSGALEVAGTYNCDSATCEGLYNFGSITNYDTITIQGTYSCAAGAFCFGLVNDIDGTITDVNCGTLSPQVSPYFFGNPVLNSGTCTTVGVPQFPLGLVALMMVMVPMLIVVKKRLL